MERADTEKQMWRTNNQGWCVVMSDFQEPMVQRLVREWLPGWSFVLRNRCVVAIAAMLGFLIVRAQMSLTRMSEGVFFPRGVL